MPVWPTYNRGLVYHKVSPQLEVGLTTTTPGQFKAQMQELKRLGFSFATLRDFDSVDNPVFVTFDDAYDCIWEHAVPSLIELGGVATVYVIADYVGKKNAWDYFKPASQVDHLAWDRLRELDELGWEIGSHGCSHRNLLILSKAERLEELRRSKDVLEERLGREVTSFCPPYNQWNSILLEEINEAGYSSISISFPIEPLPPWPGHIQPRLGVYIYDLLPLFRSRLKMTPLMPITILGQKFTNIMAQAPIISRRLKGG